MANLLEILVEDVFQLILARAGPTSEYAFHMTNKNYYRNYMIRYRERGFKKGDFTRACAASNESGLLLWAEKQCFYFDATALEEAAKFGHRKTFNLIWDLLELDQSSDIVEKAAAFAGKCGRSEFFCDPPLRFAGDLPPRHYISPIVGFNAALENGKIEMMEFLVKNRRVEIRYSMESDFKVIKRALKPIPCEPGLEFLKAHFPKHFENMQLIAYAFSASGSIEAFEWLKTHYSDPKFLLKAFQDAFRTRSLDLARYIATKYPDQIDKRDWDNLSLEYLGLKGVKLVFDELAFDIRSGDIFCAFLETCYIEGSHIESQASSNFTKEKEEILAYVLEKGCPVNIHDISRLAEKIDDERLFAFLKEKGIVIM